MMTFQNAPHLLWPNFISTVSVLLTHLIYSLVIKMQEEAVHEGCAEEGQGERGEVYLQSAPVQSRLLALRRVVREAQRIES